MTLNNLIYSQRWKQKNFDDSHKRMDYGFKCDAEKPLFWLEESNGLLLASQQLGFFALQNSAVDRVEERRKSY
jgi:hypothetical protein